MICFCLCWKLKLRPEEQIPCHSRFPTGSFAVLIGDPLQCGIIYGSIRGSFPVWGSFAVGDHLRRCTDHNIFLLRLNFIQNDKQLFTSKYTETQFKKFVCLERSVMWGSTRSLDSFSGILFPSASFRTNISLSRVDLSIFYLILYAKPRPHNCKKTRCRSLPCNF